jgi:hypothetical protein
LFEETQRPDAKYQHRGRIYVPASSPYLHFVSLTKGAMRMIILSQVDQTNQMRGIITTLNRQGAALMPVASPIVYRKLASSPADSELGEIGPSNDCYETYRGMISEALDDGFARLVSEV